MKSILFAIKAKQKTNQNTNEDANGSSRKSKSNKRKKENPQRHRYYRYNSFPYIFGQNNDQQVFFGEIDRSTIEFINDRSTDDY